jgi:hypothetical protein
MMKLTKKLYPQAIETVPITTKLSESVQQHQRSLEMLFKLVMQKEQNLVVVVVVVEAVVVVVVKKCK